MASQPSYLVTLYDIIWLYFHFYELYNNQTYQDGKPTRNNFRLQVRMTAGHEKLTTIASFKEAETCHYAANLQENTQAEVWFQ